MQKRFGHHLVNTIGITLLVLSFYTSAGVELVRFVDASSIKNNPNNRYFIEVLNLALSKSEAKYGDYILQSIDIPITQQRHFIELSRDRIDVFWTMASSYRDNFARSVPIPLAFGSYGIRIAAVNRDSQVAFSQVRDVVGLNEFTAISGKDWPDSTILRDNGVRVDSSLSENNFYRILGQDSQFYYPRAVTEVFSEFSLLDQENVDIDSALVIVYPAVMYFYVANSNVKLAKRLEEGLQLAINDGSLKALFFSFPHHKTALAQAKLASRHRINLLNPLLPDGTNVETIMSLQQQIFEYRHENE
ncbi:hypothetical protein PALB_37610 [Pseudoalteromonas luteoviolacea B = ATCC 29581]|nr:hypothetical protein PALB_37610 [Pseudoalteromonas luteoviolacea B = ATCC 29581]